MALHHRVIAHATSGQSHLIVAAVLLSFLVWITLQGHLARYLNALGIGSAARARAAVGQATGGIAGGLLGPGGPLSNLPNPFATPGGGVATPPIFGN